MPRRFAACTQCRTPLPDAALNSGGFSPCPGCGSMVLAEVFPALFRPLQTGQAGEVIVIEGEASCFYHSDRKAVVPCAECGRFLCALCDVELNGRHLCPNCLDAGRRKGKLVELESRRTLYDSAAVSLAVFPLVAWPITIFTAPLAVFFAIYGWRKPGSLVPRTRIRAWLALLIAGGQIAGWSWLVYSMVRTMVGGE